MNEKAVSRDDVGLRLSSIIHSSANLSNIHPVTRQFIIHPFFHPMAYFSSIIYPPTPTSTHPSAFICPSIQPFHLLFPSLFIIYPSIHLLYVCIYYVTHLLSTLPPFYPFIHPSIIHEIHQICIFSLLVFF